MVAEGPDGIKSAIRRWCAAFRESAGTDHDARQAAGSRQQAAHNIRLVPLQQNIVQLLGSRWITQDFKMHPFQNRDSWRFGEFAAQPFYLALALSANP